MVAILRAMATCMRLNAHRSSTTCESIGHLGNRPLTARWSDPPQGQTPSQEPSGESYTVPGYTWYTNPKARKRRAFESTERQLLPTHSHSIVPGGLPVMS